MTTLNNSKKPFTPLSTSKIITNDKPKQCEYKQFREQYCIDKESIVEERNESEECGNTYVAKELKSAIFQIEKLKIYNAI